MKPGILVTIAAMSMVGGGCVPIHIAKILHSPGIKGSGKAETKTIDVAGLTGLRAGGAFKITITPDDSPLVVTCDDNLLPHLTHEVTDGILSLGFDQGISTSSPIEAKVGIKNLKLLDLSGACTLDANGVTAEDLEVGLSGASKADLAGRVAKADLSLSGSGRLVLDAAPSEVALVGSGAAQVEIKGAGDISTLKADLSGASSANVAGRIRNADVQLSGASSADLSAEKITGEASGASHLRLTSEPKVIDFETTGASHTSIGE